ncbi:MAG: 7-carboxy-7-deazaguanine synthase QueE [Cytophagales bacterium]|nr:MAG: 7-carboxy-7-deazaguanine synthase QueE [Cytophagales bacterium]TAF61283.1 MAG: 7-carboxy-7-deazaguanine synthase QueE [Cytophagales bacterium]
MEQFYTLQGEGFYQGHAAYFIRLGGCDVGCTWCDVKESWSMTAHPMRSVTDIVSLAAAEPARLAVITGGEPLMHSLDELTAALKAAGFSTNIETSGAHPLSGHWDWICLSPKKFKKPLPEILQKANELKIIVSTHTDFSWAELYASQMNPNCQLFLQPEWDQSERMLPHIVAYVKAHPKWQISLQIHKFLDIP